MLAALVALGCSKCTSIGPSMWRLPEGARTVTQSHLRQTALSETRVELALRNVMESEAELTEAEGADERLLALLGLREASPPSHPQNQVV
jgi:hypothetical protein